MSDNVHWTEESIKMAVKKTIVKMAIDFFGKLKETIHASQVVHKASGTVDIGNRQFSWDFAKTTDGPVLLYKDVTPK